MGNASASPEQQLYPLTHPQKRIWYIEQLYPQTALYNIGGPARIKGPVNFELLQTAINLFVARNQAVRLRLREQNGEILQYVAEHGRLTLDFFDFSTANEPEQAFQQWIEQEAGRGCARATGGVCL